MDLMLFYLTSTISEFAFYLTNSLNRMFSKVSKSDRQKMDEWEMRMLCDMAGIPCYKKR